MGLSRRFALIGWEKNTKKVKTGILEQAYLRVKFSASSGVSSFEKKKSYGLFSFCTGGLLPRHHWQMN
jgi:hypothetical protein